MIATWMLYATLIGVFASLAAHALDRAVRAYRLPTRFIWLGAMIATLVAPFGVYATRSLALRSNRLTEVTVGAAKTLAVGRPESSRSIVTRAFAAVTAVGRKADRPIAYLWVLLSILMLGRLVAATIMLWHRRSQWTSREIDGIRIYVTPDLGPAVVALPASRILLPEWLLRLDSAHVSMVLRHEREHHLAGDARVLVSATIMTALVPWNLAIWWLSRRLRLAVEMDCDARVLRADPRVNRYGSLLLAIAQHPRTALHVAATLTESTSDLERRIDAMTSSRPSAPRIVAGALSVVAVAAVFAACMTPSPDLVSPPQPQLTEVALPAGRDSVANSARPRVGANQTMFEFHVEKPATLLATNPSPAYPAQLRSANLGGVVVAKFVVDTTGRANMATFVVVKSDHDLFEKSVRATLPEMRWSAAELGGRKVKQLVQIPFIFSMAQGTPQVLEEVPASSAPARRDTIARVPIPPDTRPLRLHEMVTSQLTDSQNIAPPKYPNQLRMAQIEGQVIAKFVIRPDGTVDMRTFEVVKSNHPLFTQAVKDALASSRVKPEMLNGVAVSRLVMMPFVFSLSK